MVFLIANLKCLLLSKLYWLGRVGFSEHYFQPFNFLNCTIVFFCTKSVLKKLKLNEMKSTGGTEDPVNPVLDA